jgi:Sulfotransferase domain
MIHFLGIGAQKAGTTWIYQHLSQHPQICFPAGKEIHFWDIYRNKGTEWWIDLFAADPEGRKQGEITPAYATLDEGTIREIARISPNIRIFYSIRNPIARAWSSALMALGRAEMTIDEASNLWFLEHFKSAGSRCRGDYLSCLKRWRSVFSDEQFLTIMFDDIIRDPRGVLAMLCRHLGIDLNWVGEVPSAELATPVFAGPSHDLPEPLLAFLRALYKPMINPLSELLGRDLPPWLDWDGKRGGG